MINKVGMNTSGPSDEQKKIAKSNNLDWDRYVQKLDELKTNPPRMFEVTVPYFTWYHQTEFPAWYANELTATGVSEDQIPQTYDKKLIVTESYLGDLQAQVPGYLKYVTEIDPRTGEPILPKENTDNITSESKQSQQKIPALVATSTTFQETGATTQTTQSQPPPPPAPSRSRQSSSLSPTATRQSRPAPRLQESEPFDFSKLTPELQETVQRLAEQLLHAALQRVSATPQTDAQLSTLFDRTA